MYHKIMAKMPPWVHKFEAWRKSIGVTFNIKIKTEAGSYAQWSIFHYFPFGAWHGMEFDHEYGAKILRLRVVNFAPATKVMLVKRVWEDEEEENSGNS